jgi:hypothetical protein
MEKKREERVMRDKGIKAEPFSTLCNYIKFGILIQLFLFTEFSTL